MTPAQKEKIYILYRKIKGFAQSVSFYFCRIFPVDDKLVSVCAFEGKGGFGCNPKYLVQELHNRHAGVKFVWFVNDMKKELPNYIRKVPNTWWSRAYWLSRSKIWIDNYRKPYGTKKRRGQYYLNVNHYTVGIKRTGLLRGGAFSKIAYLVSKNDSDMIDRLVIDSKWCEICFDRALVYTGEFLKSGAPRCDVLFGDRNEYKFQFRSRHGLPEQARVLMYAPTFREGAENGKRFVYSGTWTLDFGRLIRNLEHKFGGTWYICIRVHPQLAPSFAGYFNTEVKDRLIDESKADDMYEILAAMDAYITDYSSAVFEAGYAHIPAFLYADDMEEYRISRGKLMWEFNHESRNRVKADPEVFPGENYELPFSVASDNDELEEDILSFDKEEYDKKLDRFHNRIGLVFDGKASRRVADVVLSKM